MMNILGGHCNPSKKFKEFPQLKTMTLKIPSFTGIWQNQFNFNPKSCLHINNFKTKSTNHFLMQMKNIANAIATTKISPFVQTSSIARSCYR
uniref:Uncharacterized protein n=1 Tax=Rhizophora mucronata TaxID=61149 RepID=A0A2P2P8Y2_RHIMU